ncbi:MAG: radical SAM protein [Phoenicibacter congonensis]|uniref:Radical SAM protein n=1 Tax=Phoenicibacter congonensis TaxID=1944646 RepID=A0AA43RIH7_9ACTN|nr:radical SAM protein [Phoenicibacter congonensis]
MTSNCNLCPRHCGANRECGKVGVCGAGAKAQVALADLHLWEEPPITGEHGSGAIFFSNCPLKCIYCQNRQISREGKGKEVTPAELANMMLELQSRKATNINLVTGTHYLDDIEKALALLGKLDAQEIDNPDLQREVFAAQHDKLTIPIVWNTSSYEAVETIHRLNKFVDIYLADFKYFSNELGKKLSKVDDYFEVATSAIKAMLEPNPDGKRADVIVRHLILPGHVEDSKRVINHVHDTFGDDVVLSIMNQYTPVLKTAADSGDAWSQKQLEKSPELARTVFDEEYEEVLDYADSLGIEDYFWQDGETCKESFIPEF